MLVNEMLIYEMDRFLYPLVTWAMIAVMYIIAKMQQHLQITNR